MKPYLPLLISLLFISGVSAGQDDLTDLVDEASKGSKEYVTATFKSFRIINAQTNETAKKQNLHFNIAHRFGDIATNGKVNVHSFFGLDQAPDIRISFDYGITDRLQVGVGRSKGLEPYKELYDGNIKYRLLMQTTDSKMPLSLTLYGVAGISGRKSSTDVTSDAYFEGSFAHRMSYVTQAVIARKFTPGFSMEVLPTWSHRNYVDDQDENDMFSLGFGARMKVTKRFAIIADYFYNFSDYRRNLEDAAGDKVYFDPLSIGIEIETGGHVFSLMFSNATGILENSFLPYTVSNWADGEFRLGFNITRNFVIGGNAW